METVTTITVDRPAPEVFAVVADMAKNPTWQGGMESCEWTSDPPIAVGSTYDQQAKFLFWKIQTSFEVTEFVADEKIRIVSTKSTFPLDITREVRATGDGSCEVIATVTGEPGGLLKLLGPITNPMVSKSVQKDYAKLKTMLESGAL